jgi:Flp pilus assembly protein TadG
MHRRDRKNRRGVILFLTLFLMVFLLGMVAFAVDLGFYASTATEMQRSADAAAIAAAWDLIERSPPNVGNSLYDEIRDARDRAVTYVSSNAVAGGAAIDRNGSNSASGNVVIGYLANDSQSSATMEFGNQNLFNAVQVTVRKNAQQNGEVPLFFARVWNMSGMEATGTATAALINNFGGFATPSNGSNLQILPFALDEDTWNDLLQGIGSDNWKWNDFMGRVDSGSDGALEFNLYPQGTGSPGNRGTVDIGSANNSTSDLARQIVHGISPADLSHIGGSIKFNDQGTLTLNGDTGISAGVKDELASIIGQRRIIPIFQSVSGPGNNAQYVITKFVGVRIMAVQLTGKMSGKYLMVQPANIIALGGIPKSGPQSSYAIYSPVRLIH